MKTLLASSDYSWMKLADNAIYYPGPAEDKNQEIAATLVGSMRNARKALLSACLCPADAIRRAEYAGDYTARLVLQEERKTLPVGAVWDYYCAEHSVPVGTDWLEKARQYEKDVTEKR